MKKKLLSMKIGGYAVSKSVLRSKVYNHFLKLGYQRKENGFVLDSRNEDCIRKAHSFSRNEKLKEKLPFIKKLFPEMKKDLLDSKDIDPMKIEPRIFHLKKADYNKKTWDLWNWWDLVWWSLASEKACGRQMRFLVWDYYHNRLIGLIRLQSPLLRWGVRDKFLGTTKEERVWVANHSMAAQRLGAIPPYNKFLGGKLVASFLQSHLVSAEYVKKYNKRMYFITTTGAFGKSTIYNRLKNDKGKICELMGYTKGSGSFHISGKLYDELCEFLDKKGVLLKRGFGSGPSAKMKNISKALKLLGFDNGQNHGIKRSAWIFPLCWDLKKTLFFKGYWEKPIGNDQGFISDQWKKRYAVKRVFAKEKTHFSKNDFCDSLEKELEKLS